MKTAYMHIHTVCFLLNYPLGAYNGSTADLCAAESVDKLQTTGEMDVNFCTVENVK